MEEIFKDIAGFSGRYQISNAGNVRSMNYLGTNEARNLKPVSHHSGYLCVKLGYGNWRYIHKLVAQAFIPNPSNKKCVNHIDGNKHNNNVSNLEWTTYKENTEHAIKTGLRNPHHNNHPSGANTVNSRRVVQYTIDGIMVREWECISDAARFIKCNPSMIINNASGRTKTFHGYIWRYDRCLSE